MVQLTREESVKLLIYHLEQILGSAGLDLLGQYNLMNGTTIVATVSAIKIDYPRLSQDIPRSFVSESGIECTVMPDPDMVFKNHSARNFQSNKYFGIILDQHHPTQGLVEAIEAVCQSEFFNIQEEPIVRGANEAPDGKGFLPPRAILYHHQAHFKFGNLAP